MRETPQHQISDTVGSEFSTVMHKMCKVPPHFHRNFELIVVIEGSCTCSVNSDHYTLQKGNAAFICPWQVHEFEVGENSTVRRLTFHEHLIITIFKYLEWRVPRSPVFALSDDILQMVALRFDEFYGEDSGSISRIEPFHKRMAVKGLLYVVGSEFLDTAELIPKTKSDAIAMEITEYISKNFKNDISLHDIAREKGYNYQYLSRIFNNYTSMNFKKMLNQYRIQQAFAMAQDTDLPFSHICFECGFQSLRSFNQVCKDTFGKTPKELRKKA